MFYPIKLDKAPALRGKLNRVATRDQAKIIFWAERRYHRSFALRIPRRCRLLVIDTENPNKRRDGTGPDGELSLGGVLEESDISLPQCPMVGTPSGGYHRYLLVPKGFRIHGKVAVWPGVDILAAGSNVILPESRTEAGQYHVLRSFEECPIPEAPRAFIKLIRTAQNALRKPVGTWRRPANTLNDLDTSQVSTRQWCLLFRNRVFRSFWERQGKAADTTDSAYEYHLAKASFSCGLNQQQTESVVLTWRRRHGLNRDRRKLRLAIIPEAWREVQPWVERWHADRDAAAQAKRATKTTNLILAYISHESAPQTPSSIAAALPIPRERAKKAMQRLATAGKLRRTGFGYELVEGVGTF